MASDQRGRGSAVSLPGDFVQFITRHFSDAPTAPDETAPRVRPSPAFVIRKRYAASEARSQCFADGDDDAAFKGEHPSVKPPLVAVEGSDRDASRNPSMPYAFHRILFFAVTGREARGYAIGASEIRADSDGFCPAAGAAGLS
jgi:hypothetical protein